MQMEHDVRAWIEGVLGEPLQGTPLIESLRDGIVLCKLMQIVLPGSIHRVHTNASSPAFMHMENIASFLPACGA